MCSFFLSVTHQYTSVKGMEQLRRFLGSGQLEKLQIFCHPEARCLLREESAASRAKQILAGKAGS